MGMDVIGLNPATKGGEYFCNDVWTWRPLADYCMKVAPDVAVPYKYWQSNDGDEADSVALADVLQKEIDSGRCESYARIQESVLELLPNEPCEMCGGTGIRKPPAESGAGDLLTGMKCNSCDGEGFKRPWACSYRFAVDNVKKFTTFLRGCGGFQSGDRCRTVVRSRTRCPRCRVITAIEPALLLGRRSGDDFPDVRCIAGMQRCCICVSRRQGKVPISG